MKRKEIVLLMVALTKGGKTTIAMALCHERSRSQMFALSNCRTEVTTDWSYGADNSEIKLIEVQLNNKAVYGTDRKEGINCEKYSENLDSKEGKYLKETFGLEKQQGLSADALEQYVLDKIKEYVDNCDDKGLAHLIKDRRSNRFLRRIKVSVPPVDEFKEFFKEKNISLVLRDTRGLGDYDPEEATKVSDRTMQELGIDNIDAVLLLGTSAPFADTVNWYKKAYKEALESVPVFIMTWQDSVSLLYEAKYGMGNENVTIANVKEFLFKAREAKENGFTRLPNIFLRCYELLEMFEIGKLRGNEFFYNYKVYNNEDLRYVCPVSDTLMQARDIVPDYDTADYKLYQIMLFENMKDILGKIIEHEKFTEVIKNRITHDFISMLQNSGRVEMYPDYRNYGRRDVCDSILRDSILGSRNGITTVKNGEILYLGAVTSGVSARTWLRSNVYSYKYSGTLRNEDGTDMIPDIPRECQENLVRMALFNIIEKKTDYEAYFRGYYFMNRYEVKKAIVDVRKKNLPGDALDNTAKEIVKYVFC